MSSPSGNISVIIVLEGYSNNISPIYFKLQY